MKKTTAYKKSHILLAKKKTQQSFLPQPLVFSIIAALILINIFCLYRIHDINMQNNTSPQVEGASTVQKPVPTINYFKRLQRGMTKPSLSPTVAQ